MEPNVRYARSSGAAIAYQVVGDGPTDLIVVPDYVSNLVYAWESDRWRTFYARLTRFSRLILFVANETVESDLLEQFVRSKVQASDGSRVLVVARPLSATRSTSSTPTR